MDSRISASAINTVARQLESNVAKQTPAKGIGVDLFDALVKELVSDGSLSKTDVNILKLFLDLMEPSDDQKPQIGLPSTGRGTGGDAPAAAGGQGSQAPPGLDGASQAQGGSNAQDKTSTAQDIINVLSKLAMSDGKMTGKELKALISVAKALSSAGESVSLEQTLKDLIASVMSDGKVTNKEAKALGQLLDAMSAGGSKTDAKALIQLIVSALSGMAKDGKLSSDELGVLQKLVGLLEKASSAGAEGGKSQHMGPDSGVDASAGATGVKTARTNTGFNSAQASLGPQVLFSQQPLSSAATTQVSYQQTPFVPTEQVFVANVAGESASSSSSRAGNAEYSIGTSGGIDTKRAIIDALIRQQASPFVLPVQVAMPSGVGSSFDPDAMGAAKPGRDSLPKEPIPGVDASWLSSEAKNR